MAAQISNNETNNSQTCISFNSIDNTALIAINDAQIQIDSTNNIVDGSKFANPLL